MYLENSYQHPVNQEGKETSLLYNFLVMNRFFLIGALLVLPFFTVSAKKKTKVSFYLPPHVLCEMDTAKWIVPYLEPTVFEAIAPKATIWNKARTVEFKVMHLFDDGNAPKEDYAIAQNKLSSGGKQDLLVMAVGDFSVYYFDSKSSVCAIYRAPDKTAIVVVASALGEVKKSILSELKKWVSTFRYTTPEDVDRAMNVSAETNWQSIFMKRAAHEKVYIKNANGYFGNVVGGNQSKKVNDALSYHKSQKDFSFKKYFDQRVRAEKLDITKEQASAIFETHGECESPIRMYVQVNKSVGISHEDWMERLRQKFGLELKVETVSMEYRHGYEEVSPPPAAEDVDSDAVLSFAQQMPEFPGGEEALMKYLTSQMKFPKSAEESKASGVVYVSYVVDKRGAVKDVRVLRNSTGNMDCATEAVRVVKAMPNWKPAMQNGNPVNVQMNIPIRFHLE
jgi:TonB family protein